MIFIKKYSIIYIENKKERNFKMFDDFNFSQNNDYEYENPLDFMIGSMALIKTLQEQKKRQEEKERKCDEE